jgi:dihydrolipoamide dehydrogenase
MDTHDVIVIGAGPAGYVAAIRAAQLGLRVTVVEKEYIGGVCLNIGCIPSKSLLKNAELAYTLRNKANLFGISFDNLKLDYSAAVKRSRQVSNRLTKGVEFLLKKNKVALVSGTARFTSPQTIRVGGAKGQEELSAEHIIIATGARPFILPGVEIDGKQVLTYKEAILQESLPESVLIVGAGAIGMEFATIWNSYGVPVTVVEMLDRILPNEDEEVSAVLNNAFNKQRIKTVVNSKVTKIEPLKTKVNVIIETPEGEDKHSTDQVLLATSFIPNSQNLGLEEIGVELDQQGFVQIDENMATNLPGIWAIGDVTGKLMLAHVAMAMGEICAERIAGLNSSQINYQNMPRGTFSHPQVASFGLTQQQAEKAGYKLAIGRFNFQANGKALGLNDYTGWVKIIADTQSGEILGAHLVGPEVTELLPELTLAQKMELTPAEIGHNIHAHPTLGEVLQEAAKAVFGEAIHA